MRSKSSSGKVAQELATAKQENAAIKGALIEACTELEQVRMRVRVVRLFFCCCFTVLSVLFVSACRFSTSLFCFWVLKYVLLFPNVLAACLFHICFTLAVAGKAVSSS